MEVPAFHLAVGLAEKRLSLMIFGRRGGGSVSVSVTFLKNFPCGCVGSDCDDTLQAKCRFCAGVGPNAGDICDRGRENWGSVDRDCWGADEDCRTVNFLGPRTGDDFRFPETSEAKYCMDIPCEFGACCFADGFCYDLHDEMWCDDNDGTFLGYGTECAPNCCEQPYQGPGEEVGGDCCGDIYWCTGTVAGQPVPGGTRCDPDGVDPYNCFSTCRCSIDGLACDIANGECHDLADPPSSTYAPCSVEVQNCLDLDETCIYVEPCNEVCSLRSLLKNVAPPLVGDTRPRKTPPTSGGATIGCPGATSSTG
ncbi:MAG: hypothetical protein JSU63_14870 [Phycisphaerales bacterium]|nr:MAG: hypothetical protein JSU63_14870 [Phycisphaerales bacterium]